MWSIVDNRRSAPLLILLLMGPCPVISLHDTLCGRTLLASTSNSSITLAALPAKPPVQFTCVWVCVCVCVRGGGWNPHCEGEAAAKNRQDTQPLLMCVHLTLITGTQCALTATTCKLNPMLKMSLWL